MINENQNYKAKEVLISEMVYRKISNNGGSSTNGRFSVEDLLLKHTKIKDELEYGESIQYIAYKKSTKIKLVFVIFFITTLIFSFLSIIKGLTTTWFTNESLIAILLVGGLISYFIGFTNMFIITNKSFILWKKNLKSIKIHYRDLSCVRLSKNNSEVVYTIIDKDNLKLSITKSYYKNTLHSDILTALSEEIELPEKEAAKDIKNLKLIIAMVIISDIIMIYSIHQLPYMKNPIILGYSGAFIATLWIVVFTFIFVLQIVYQLKKKADKN